VIAYLLGSFEPGCRIRDSGTRMRKMEVGNRESRWKASWDAVRKQNAKPTRITGYGSIIYEKNARAKHEKKIVLWIFSSYLIENTRAVSGKTHFETHYRPEICSNRHKTQEKNPPA
jgi:hypothetical protein